MLRKIAELPAELGKVGELLADNGYFSEGNVERLRRRRGRPRQFASVLHGQSVYRFVRAELDRASEHAHEMLVLGEKSNDVKMQHDGLYMSGVLCSVMGKFTDARAFCEGAPSLMEP